MRGLIIILTGICTCYATAAQTGIAKEKMDLVFHNTAKMLQAIHYQPQQWDDDFSGKIYTGYFEELDPTKKIFLARDTSKLQRFKLRLDDELAGDPARFYKDINELYKKRLQEVEKVLNDILATPFSFAETEMFNADEEEKQFAGSEQLRIEKWRKYLKYNTLVQLADLLEQSKNDTTIGRDTMKLEAKARANVLKIEQRTLTNIRKLTSDEEAFNNYLNHIINLYDPHSHYYLPVDRRGFQESLSGVYYGIGALLQEHQGKVKIAELMIGGPAWKSGLVDKDDVIIKVAQGNEAPANVEGLPMQDVIKLTRGEKGTTVTITFRKKDGTVRPVTMLRDALQLDDNFVKSAVIEERGFKTGYIFFPKFYTAFGDENGRSCAADMAIEVEKLKQEGVHGIIIDIRNNGGGSLGEVINMLGLFIKEGPMVQVKNAHQAPEQGGVKNKAAFYDGPLIVLVNEMSASASEIFAGAIQDYGRGIVVGSNTYGKGTVQRSLAVPDDFTNLNSNGELGSLHVTLQKYYRVTGAATQMKGVTPDIILPGLYEPYKMREKDQPTALTWDTVQSLQFKRYGLPVSQTVEEANKMLLGDSLLAVLREHVEWIGNRADSYTLTLSDYTRQKSALNNRLEKVRSSLVSSDSLHVRNLKEVEESLEKKEEFRRNSNKAFLRSISKDLYLNRAVKVLELFANKMQQG